MAISYSSLDVLRALVGCTIAYSFCALCSFALLMGHAQLAIAAFLALRCTGTRCS